jgi:hypothetical protein
MGMVVPLNLIALYHLLPLLSLPVEELLALVTIPLILLGNKLALIDS